MTIREALGEAGSALAAAGIESPGLDASLLLAEVLNVSRSSLIAAGPEPLAEESFVAFNALIKRRLGGECVAYITGKKEFYGLEFLVTPSVLVPRPETEMLVEAAIELLIERREKGEGRREKGEGRREKGTEKGRVRVLELCTGSGAVAIALKHEVPELEIWATDISREALAVAQTNAARLLPPDAIHFRQGNLFEALLPDDPPLAQHASPPPDNRSSPPDNSSFLIPHSSLLTACPAPKTLGAVAHFSLILANPPYVPTADIAGLSPEVRREPTLALDGGNDGLDLIRKIISQAPQFLCPGGALLLEADPRQMKQISSLFESAGFTNIQTRRDLSGKERIILAFSGVFSYL